MRRLIFIASVLLSSVLASGCGRQLPTQSNRDASFRAEPGNGSGAAGTAGAAGYVLADLGVLPGGSFSSARSISSSGVVAGSSHRGDGAYVPILWSNGRMTELGSLGGTNGSAGGVNNASQVAGSSYLSGGGARAFAYVGGKMKDLGKLSGFNSGACAINAAGLVIGSGDIYGGGDHAFTYQVGGTGLRDLGTLGGQSAYASAINDAGLIVGQSNVAGEYYYGGPLHACSWTNRVIRDLGTLGGPDGVSAATAVSLNGRIAGWTTSPTGNHACTFATGAITDLGTVPGFRSSRATGINASGTVIGLLSNGSYGGNSTRAFVYSGGKIDNIANRVSNLGGWTIIQLNAINDAGVIVGVAIVPSGSGTHAVILRPQ